MDSEIEGIKYKKAIRHTENKKMTIISPSLSVIIIYVNRLNSKQKI